MTSVKTGVTGVTGVTSKPGAGLRASHHKKRWCDGCDKPAENGRKRQFGSDPSHLSHHPI